MSTASEVRALVRYCAAQLGPLDRIEHGQTPWRSATFGGARHWLRFSVDATADIDTFVRTLPEADIPLHGGFVADAMVTTVATEADCARVTIEALIIDAT